MPRMMRAVMKRKLFIWHPMRVRSVSGASGVPAIVNKAGYGSDKRVYLQVFRRLWYVYWEVLTGCLEGMCIG